MIEREGSEMIRSWKLNACVAAAMFLFAGQARGELLLYLVPGTNVAVSLYGRVSANLVEPSRSSTPSMATCSFDSTR